jgi:hypothetical protein
MKISFYIEHDDELNTVCHQFAEQQNAFSAEIQLHSEDQQYENP